MAGHGLTDAITARWYVAERRPTGGIAMKCVRASLLFPFFFGFAGTAAAQNLPDPDRSCLGRSPPTKEIRIKNNSLETIFPVISVPIYDRNQAHVSGKKHQLMYGCRRSAV